MNEITKLKLILLIFLIFIFSCNKRNEKITAETKIEDNVKQQTDKAQKWLYSVFKCNNSEQYCFYLENEKEICTKRFYDFMSDSEEIYGASNLTVEELPSTLQKYTEKWSEIYTLRNENDGETWLFGRGNDDMENIKQVKISKISDLNYDVYVDYGNEIKTKSKVKLIEQNNSYKIDYCETKFED